MKTLPISVGKLCLSVFILSSLQAAANKKDPGTISLHSISPKTASGLVSPKTASGTAASRASYRIASPRIMSRRAARRAELRMITLEAFGIFDEMGLKDSGLSQKAFQYAFLGYRRLLKRKILHKSDVLSICDFSQSSGSKRMYVIDVRNRKLLYRTYVAHGISSGREYASSFSNTPESYKSSLGFYVTRNTYFGNNGLSLRIDGVERGINNKAFARNIVIHGASYVSERILHKYGVMGTTFGCPAIPEEMTRAIIPVLKNGTCFFIYYPSKKYLSGSSILNG
jgi:hypothetical protein